MQVALSVPSALNDRKTGEDALPRFCSDTASAYTHVATSCVDESLGFFRLSLPAGCDPDLFCQHVQLGVLIASTSCSARILSL